MGIEKHCILSVFLTVVHLVVCPALAKQPQDTALDITRTEHTPSLQVAGAWLDSALHNQFEIWEFTNFQTLKNFARRHGYALPPKPPLEDTSEKYVWLITREQKTEVPNTLLQQIYIHQATNNSPYLEYLLFPSEEYYRSFLSSAGINSITEQRLWDQHTYRDRTIFFLPVTSELAPLINENVRRELIYQIQVQNTYLGGNNAALYVGPRASPSEIADYFKALRDPTEMERDIRSRRQEAGGIFVFVPFQDILSPKIRDNYGTFAPCNGPNCHYAGISAHKDSRIPPREIEKEELKLRLDTRYHEVRGGLILPGDLFVFSNHEESRHTWAYISELSYRYLVWEKPGRFKRDPFTFRLWDKESLSYGGDGDLTVKVHRHNSCARAMSGLAE